MALDSRNLKIAFAVALMALLFVPVMAPEWRLLFFAPFLVICCYQKSLQQCLWIALLCGMIVDLLSYQMRLGLHALNYCLTIGLLYNQKRNFFADSFSTLPIMTYFFGVFSTFIQVFLLYIFESSIPFSWRWLFVDGLLMPGLDAVYGFVCFMLPQIVISKPARKAKDYFLK